MEGETHLDHRHILDILSDGSDSTGPGCAFLTVVRSSSGFGFDDTTEDPYDRTSSMTPKTILARYALSGLPSPLARLVTDQRYKLASVRATFLPSLDVRVISGLSALLLSLSDSGTEKLTVVGPVGAGDIVDGIVDTVLGRRRGWPRVEVCEMPNTECQWWKVYEDEHIVAHARYLKGNGRGDLSSSVVYTFTVTGDASADTSCSRSNQESTFSLDSSSGSDTDTLSCSQLVKGGNIFSFAVLPPNFAMLRAHTMNWLLPLPEDAVRKKEKTRCSSPPLRFVLHINPGIDSLESNAKKGHGPGMKLFHREMLQLALHHLATIPDLLCPDSWDGGILIRSRFQTQRLRGIGLECAFPVRSGSNELVGCNNYHGRRLISNGVAMTPLPSCTSVLLDQPALLKEAPASASDEQEHVRFMDRQKTIVHRCEEELKEPNIDTVCNCYGNITGGAANLNAKESLAEAVSTVNQGYENSSSGTGAGAGRRTFVVGVRRPMTKEDIAPDADEIVLEDDGSSYASADGREVQQYERDEKDIVINVDHCKDELDHNMGFVRRQGTVNDELGTDAKEDRSSFSPPDKTTKSHTLDPAVPHVLVLGTGCASPSPVRGSSGYALLCPSGSDGCGGGTRFFHSFKPRLALMGLVECGEGTLMSLSRYLLSSSTGSKKERKSHDLMMWLQDLRFIWISHGHLDHYSDLPVVVQAANEAQESRIGRKMSDCAPPVCSTCDLSSGQSLSRKRPRSGGYPDTVDSVKTEEVPQTHYLQKWFPLVIIAPPKVLRFLDISLRCRNGVPLERTPKSSELVPGGNRLFYGIAHRDFDRSTHPTVNQVRHYVSGLQLQCETHGERSHQGSFSRIGCYHPIKFVRSIPVDHCPDAHALILGLNLPSRGHGAGESLGRQFNICYSGDGRPSDRLVRACWGAGCQPISLLIHEATFDDTKRGRTEAVKKKHSTLREAVDIGRRMRASACLLSHFSGRYPRLPPSHVSSPLLDREANELDKSNGSSIVSGQQIIAGCAVDGLIMPLTQAAFSALHSLDLCFAEVFGPTSKP